MGKYKRKLFNKRATSKKNIDEIKNKDGRDDQIADVRGGNLDDDSVRRRVVGPAAVGFDEVGPREIGGNRIYVDGINTEHIAPRAIGFGEIADQAVAPQKLDRAYSPPHSHPYAPTNHSHNYASSGHNHDDRYVRLSINFKRDLPLEGKKEIMDLLAMVEQTAQSPVEILLARLTRLSTDDPGMGGEDLVEFLEHGDERAVEAWYEHHSYERMLRRALREGSEAARVRAHFDRDVRRLAYEEGVDIFEISDHYLDEHLSPAVGNIIRENWKAYCNGDQPPTWF